MAFSELARGALLLGAATSCGIVLGIEEPTSRACTACDGGTGADVSSSGEGGGAAESSAGLGESAGEGVTAGAGAGLGGAGGSETGGQGNPGTGATRSGEGGEAGTPATQAGSTHSGAGEGGAATLCDRYCDSIQESCTGDGQQYVDWIQCNRACALLPEGADGDDHGNSIACRLEYADRSRFAAGVELESYCRRAGPGGDGVCGSNCDGYCTIMAQTCTGSTAPLHHFPDIPRCLDECSTIPDEMVGYSTNDAVVFDGNHVQCRLFHAVSATTHDVEEHCEHAMGATLCEPVP
jgi:hypothetical protein